MSSLTIQHYRLDNGLNVVLENIPFRVSATMGIWVPIGSRNENINQMGYSHFTEHMLFKGTEKRTYLDISREIDRVGGFMNASTSKEITNYYVTINSKFKQTALDVLSDIFFNSNLPENEFNIEKQVILEEIKMSEDTPDDHLFDLFYQDFFGDNPLGRPIAGSLSSINKSNRAQLYDFYENKYGSDGCVLSLAGRLWETSDEETELKNLIEDLFGLKSKQLKGTPEFNKENPINKTKEVCRHYEKKLEQLHFAFGMPGISKLNENDAFMSVYTHLLGGSMSSRLFRKLREENGLCYAVSSFHSQFLSEGLWGVYCGTSSENYFKAVDLMIKEIINSLDGGISKTEIIEARDGLAASLELAMESPSRRADFNARSILYFNKLRDWKEKIKEIEKVNPEKMIEQMKSLWSGKEFLLCSLGKLNGKKVNDQFREIYKDFTLI
ncbi:MAG: insulinase family protein [Spirochaetia bacterium]|nr:insulinase family protein [Spirochaetia bacterium]